MRQKLLQLLHDCVLAIVIGLVLVALLLVALEVHVMWQHT